MLFKFAWLLLCVLPLLALCAEDYYKVPIRELAKVVELALI